MTSARGVKKWLLMRRQCGPGWLGIETSGPIAALAGGSEETTGNARYLEDQPTPITGGVYLSIDWVVGCTSKF